jgi:hypothetical protein
VGLADQIRLVELGAGRSLPQTCRSSDPFRDAGKGLIRGQLALKEEFGNSFFDGLRGVRQILAGGDVSVRLSRLETQRRSIAQRQEKDMPTFCGKCGSPVAADGQFCPKCGATAGEAATTGPWSAGPPADTSPSFLLGTTVSVSHALSTSPVPAAAQPMGAGVKLLIAAVVIIFLGAGVAVAGMAYAAHRVSQKFHEIAGDRIDSASSSETSAASRSHASGDPCRLLSKQDVSTAIGVKIVGTQATDGGCSFYAKGDQAEMSAKHVAAMMAKNGADAQTQKMMQSISGGLLKTFQQEKPDSSDGSGTVMVFNYDIDDNAAEQMKLNRNAMKSVGGPAVTDLEGVGDEAFVTGDSSLIARKGNKLIRIMYMTCPCNLDAVKPLAQKLADAL